uniref:Uncharacterized protein n=1 Tax=Desertifilum tharense IPPAS B-1220 TaxID=1781255 RepID=A0ACD5GUF1_9CYAN
MLNLELSTLFPLSTPLRGSKSNSTFHSALYSHSALSTLHSALYSHSALSTFYSALREALSTLHSALLGPLLSD